MPTPRKNETKEDFINRCIPYIVENEGREPEQATAMCYSIWEESKKSVVVKILNHSIYKSEPTLLLDDILINGDINKKVKTSNILLTHAHQLNVKGLNGIKEGNIYLLEKHEHFLKHHVKDVDTKFELHYIKPYEITKINTLEIFPILVKHQVQEIYGEESLGYIINRNVAIITPCYKIPKKSQEYLKNIEVLIIDGGYRIKSFYNDHKSILETLKQFREYKNLKHIYFLGTYKDYKIKGKIKNTSIKVDTLFKGDILKIKLN